ncbi:J domain-containing protein [Corallococcus sp. M34]|uniref:J domain-containing protein n=1 Tax=Citreicoccus inhibens TaxID=2849499 RepID=UPI001C2327A9|nr:J domain-containing protein [Citreicoccus inhibens]MBU8899075.1 J domain-containing protein [Citreicoccus inhibens]
MRKRFRNLYLQIEDDGYDPNEAYDSSRLGRYFASMKYAALLKTYRDEAHKISHQFGCANCRGTESLRSCLAAYRELKQQNIQGISGWTQFQLTHGGTLDGLVTLLQDTYGAKFSDEFGKTFSQKALQDGILSNKQPVNALTSKWYSDLKVLLVAKSGQPPLRKFLPKGVGVAITKASAKAHAVVARASIAVGIRFGFMEYAAYLGSGAKSQVRPVRAVAVQALSLVDSKATLHWLVQDEITWLSTVWNGTESTLKNATSDRLAETLIGRLVDVLGQLTVSSGDYIRANCFALCSVYRAVILALAKKKAVAGGWSGSALRKELDRSRALISYYPKTQPTGSTPFIHLKEFETQCSKAGSCDVLDVVEKHCTWANNWLSAGDVEFAKQCGECENSQGALDLVGRFVDSRVSQGATLDLMVGVLYSTLTERASVGDTPFDLACAIACYATTTICGKLQGLAPQSDVVLRMMETYQAEAPLFLTYMETLLLGMGLQGTTYLPKVIEEAHERVKPGATFLGVQTRPLSSVEQFRGPTVKDMELAATTLGLSWKDLRIDEEALKTITRAYRREALIVHPDKPLGSTLKFQDLQNAQEVLKEYFGEKRAKEILAITYYV